MFARKRGGGGNYIGKEEKTKDCWVSVAQRAILEVTNFPINELEYYSPKTGVVRGEEGILRTRSDTENG